MIMRNCWLCPVHEIPIPGNWDVIEEDAWADLILVDGDVLKDITLLGDPEKNFIMIMKGGEIYKNRV